MSRLYILAALVSVAAACSPTTSPKPTAARGIAEGIPAGVRTLISREIELAASEDYSSEDGHLTIAAGASLGAPISSEDGEAYYAELDIGTAAPVQCYIYREGIDLAGSIVSVADDLFVEIEETHGRITGKQVVGVNADNQAWGSILEAAWVLGIEGDQGIQAGQLKSFAASRDDHGITCHHFETGYRRAFATISRQVLESFSFDDADAAPPSYQEIFVVSVQEVPIGVTHAKLFPLEGGTTQVEVASSFLALVSPSELAPTDNYVISHETDHGDLISKQLIGATGTEITTNLRLEQTNGSEWQVNGTYKDAPYETTITAQRIRSTMGYARDLRTLIATEGVGGTATAQVWDDMDPSRLVDVNLKVIDALPNGRYDAEIMLGPVRMYGIFDSTGTMVEASMTARDSELKLRRVYRDGEF